MFGKVVSILKLIFSRTSGVSRSQERYRRAGRTAFAAVIAHIVNIATAMATVPITLSYLGTDRYGLWMAFTSFVAFLTFTDMGLGIGLQNALAECYGRDDHKNPRSYVSSAMFVMILVFMTLTGIAIFVLPKVPLDRLIKVGSEDAHADLLPTAQAVIITFGFGLPTGLIQRIYNAYQRGYWANMTLVVGRIAGFIGVLVCVWLKVGLPTLSACFMGLPFVCLAVGSIFLLRKLPWLYPSFSGITWNGIRRIFSTGSKAVVVQFSAVLMSSGPALVIANRLGASAVTPFVITQKLLALLNIILSMVLLSLWPAYGEAAARGDWAWVKKTFRHSVKLGFAVQIPFFILISFIGRYIIHIWAGERAVPSWPLLMAINVWYLIAVWNICTSTTLNGLDHMIGQAIYSPLLAFLGLLGGYWLAGLYGVAGIVWSITLIGISGTAIGCMAELLWVLNRSDAVNSQLQIERGIVR